MTLVERFQQYQAFYLYGATPAAEGTLEFLKKHGKTVRGVIDRDPQKQKSAFFGFPVVAPETLFAADDNDVGIVIVSAYQAEITAFLLENRIFSQRIFPFLDGMFWPTYSGDFAHCPALDRVANGLQTLEEKRFLSSWRSFKSTGDLATLVPMPSMRQQYAHQSWLSSLKKGGTALDIGAYDGVTSLELARSGHFDKVIAFEPFEENFRLLEQTAESHLGVAPIEARKLAIGAERASIAQPKETVSSRSRINGDVSYSSGEVDMIEVYPLDDLELDNVSLIKVDIEGFELDFLKGAEQTLRENRPHLAISAYHHADHPREIAEFLYQRFGGVNIHVGHHPLAVYELEYYVSFND